VTKLHSLLKPFMLRRMKADVEICLPRKQEILLYAPMSEEQQKINKQLLDRTLQVRGGARDTGVFKCPPPMLLFSVLLSVSVCQYATFQESTW
jgi:SNF2 family DNA or RNA helicase